MNTLEQLKEKGEAPEFLTEEGYKTLLAGYLQPNETPVGMYRRVAKGAANILKRPDLEQKFFDIIFKNYLCLSTPVAANFATNKALPISCYSNHVPDSTIGIANKNTELMLLSKYGGGVGSYFGDLRPKGSVISGTGGISDSIVKWAKIYDSSIAAVSQGNTRRGSAALYLPVDHGDFQDFISMRKPTGDMNTRCLNLHHAITIPDDFMHRAKEGDSHARAKWEQLLELRVATGEPYFLFTDNVNNNNPDCYKDKGFKVFTSNLCNEITLLTDKDHTFVCCLSSLNLAKFDDWKDTDTVELSIYFLDAVMEEFIQKASKIEGFESAVRFAVKSRALGLGTLGYHTALQQKRIAFDSFDAMALNALMFRTIKNKAELATTKMAKEYGEPEWCRGYNRRHTHLLATAPTTSNSLISGGVSQGIEPIAANIYVQNSAKGSFVRKNKNLEVFLEEKNLNTDEVWHQINKDAGSVLNVSGISENDKKIFLTAKEINQHAIVKQASQRQKWIDQGQSVNLFFASNASPKYIHDVHWAAWEGGMKGLYYLRSESVLRSDLASRTKDECEACSG